MRREFLVLLIILLLVGCSKQHMVKEEVVINVLTFGYEDTRVDNLILAAERLNQEFDEQKIPKSVIVNVEKYTGQLWDEYEKIFKERFEEGDLDIFITGHEDIGWLASDGYITQMDMLAKKDTFSDVYGTLWQAVEWEDSKWGILQDFEVQLILANKKALTELGWNAEEIQQLAVDIKKGQFTLEDMTLLAKSAVDKGIVQNGILHRPVNGQAFYMMAKNFGAFHYDDKDGEITILAEELLNSLTYFYDIAQVQGVLPQDNTLKNWEQVNQIVIDKDVLFYYGATYTIYDLVTESGANEEEILNTYVPMLIPTVKEGGKPITISHPLVYTVTSISDQKDIANRLLEYGSNPEAQVIHSVETYHLPVSKGASESPAFKENQFLVNLMYTLDYTTFLPNDDHFESVYQGYYEAIQDVELGLKSPEEAALEFQKAMKKEFKYKCIIK